MKAGTLFNGKGTLQDCLVSFFSSRYIHSSEDGFFYDIKEFQIFDYVMYISNYLSNKTSFEICI